MTESGWVVNMTDERLFWCAVIVLGCMAAFGLACYTLGRFHNSDTKIANLDSDPISIYYRKRMGD